MNESAWSSLFSEAKAIPILEVAERLGADLKRAGPDYVGSCPSGCASHDGFIVTPKKGIFLCRPSSESGDSIDMCMHVLGITKAAALEYVTGRQLPGRTVESDKEREAREAQTRKREASIAARKAAEAKADARKRTQDEIAVDDILARAVAIPGTHAEAYLNKRGLKPPKSMLGDLKFVDSLDYWGLPSLTAKNLVGLGNPPAMIAIIRNVAGEMIGLRITYLDPVDPAKYSCPILPDRNRPRKVRKVADLQGGLVRLGLLGEKVAIAEGVETALAFAELVHYGYFGPEFADYSYASAFSLGNMPKIELPEHVNTVLLVGDGDSDPKTTRLTLIAAGKRLIDEGRHVSVSMAPPSLDANDFLLKRAGA